MSGLGIGLAVAVASLVMLVFTYRSCATIAQVEEVLPRWAKEHGLRIIRKESRALFQGPFFPNQYRPVYYVTFEDQQCRHRRAWVRVGWWYVIGFRESVEVQWEE